MIRSIIFLALSVLVVISISCNKDDNPVTPTTGTIAGKVLNSTGDTAMVGAAVSTNPPTSAVFTNATGEYSIGDVSPGNYTVNVIKSGFFDGSVTIKVNAGSTTTANVQMIRIVDQTGMIRGKVTNAGGDTLIAGASVTTSPPTSSVTTNSLGEYTISNVNPSAYTITATRIGYNEGNTTVTVITGKVAIGDIKMSIIVNHAPNTPVLVSPSNGFTGLPRTLTLSWTCTDPDGDNMTYDVYLDKTTTPTQKVASDITTPSYTATNLDSAATYYWRVIAKDNKGAISNSSPINSFRTIFLTAGLVAYYPFNGNANDESGNGNNGTVFGGAITNNTLVLGDNASDRLSLPYTIINGMTDFTFSARLKINTIHLIGSWACNIFISGARNSEQNAITFGYRKTLNKWWLGINEASNPIYYFDENTLIADGNWHYITVLRNGTTARLYIDGVIIGTDILVVADQISIDPGGSIIGQEQDIVGGNFAQHQSWAGEIDGIRIYNRALTATEIQALYHEGGW